jgi:hypothetical protein
VVTLDGNRLVFTDQFRASMVDSFLACVAECLSENAGALVLDFELNTAALPDSMIPVLATVDWLRNSGRAVSVTLPREPRLHTMFLQSLWAHYLDPTRFEANTQSMQQFVARRFTDSQEQQRVVNEFMRLVVGELNPPADVLAAFEWSINEITDNVLTHSASSRGGFAQILSIPNPPGILFCVADAGRGVLASMQEGYPELQSDSEALSSAVVAGVTRNATIGQGNGLAGTLRVASMSGGRFAVGSFRGRYFVGNEGTGSVDGRPVFHGTMVTASMQLMSEFRIEEALSLSSRRYSQHSILDYHDEEGGVVVLRLARETEGVGSRPAGAFIRRKAIHLLTQESNEVLVLDWAGISVVSSSFADEALGKLFVELGPLAFGSRVKHRNLSSVNAALIDNAILQRVAQHMSALSR